MKLQSALALLAAAGLALTAAGCASEDATGGAAGSTSEDSAGSEQSAPEDSIDFSDPAACLEGAWLADNAFFLEGIREFGDEIKDVIGEVVLTFASDGTMTSEYRGWVITGVVEGASVTITREGTDLGTYSVTSSGAGSNSGADSGSVADSGSGHTVSISDTEMGTMLVLNAAGMSNSIIPDPAIYENAGLECDAQSANITTEDGLLKLARR